MNWMTKFLDKVLGVPHARVTLRHPDRAGEIIADRGIRRIYREVNGREYVVPYDFTIIEIVYLDSPGFWRIERVTQ